MIQAPAWSGSAGTTHDTQTSSPGRAAARSATPAAARLQSTRASRRELGRYRRHGHVTAIGKGR